MPEAAVASVFPATTSAAASTALATSSAAGAAEAAQSESNTADNSASASVKITAVATKKQVFLPPTCYSASVTPHQLTVGKRTTIVVRLGAGKAAVRGVKVLVRGPGILKSGVTDAHGVARITVTPKRSGILRVTVPSHKTCTRPQIGVVGIFTPPVTG